MCCNIMRLFILKTQYQHHTCNVKRFPCTQLNHVISIYANSPEDLGYFQFTHSSFESLTLVYQLKLLIILTYIIRYTFYLVMSVWTFISVTLTHLYPDEVWLNKPLCHL